MPKTDEILLARAKAMRSEMTPPERELRIALGTNRFGDVTFSRQVVVGPSITDSVARSRKPIVEVDGDRISIPRETIDERHGWKAPATASLARHL